MTSAFASFPSQGGKLPQQYNHSFKELLECYRYINLDSTILSHSQQGLQAYRFFCYISRHVIFKLDEPWLYCCQQILGAVVCFSWCQRLMKKLASSIRTNSFHLYYKYSFLSPHKTAATCTPKTTAWGTSNDQLTTP